MGLIDTLSAGFDRTARRLWLIVIPVLLDLGIWLGPRLSLNNLIQRTVAMLPEAPELGTQYAQAAELSRAWLAEVGKSINLLTLLSMRLLGLPGLAGSLVPPLPPVSVLQTVELPSGWMALAVAALLLLLGLLVGCVTLSLLAADARDGGFSSGYVLGVAWRSWVRLALLLMCAAFLVFGLLVGVGLITGIIGVLSTGIATLVLTFVAWTLVILFIYASVLFYFTSRAAILDDRGVIPSIRSALLVVQRNVMPTLGFLLIVNLLQAGLLHIWQLLAVNTAGMIAGIVGNAYVNTGLVMASFIFYRERVVALTGVGQERTR